jgi:hypothetical protein
MLRLRERWSLPRRIFLPGCFFSACSSARMASMGCPPTGRLAETLRGAASLTVVKAEAPPAGEDLRRLGELIVKEDVWHAPRSTS